MLKQQIRDIIDRCAPNDGVFETGLPGVQLFRVTSPIECAPAIYEPTIVAILNGSKEAILDGKKLTYDKDKYLCCTMSMPVEAGTPQASPDNPLIGVIISLKARVMTELSLAMENSSGALRQPKAGPLPQGLALSSWDQQFSDALLRLLRIIPNPVDRQVLGEGRLREVYYAILQGEAKASVRRAFGVGNEIARVIERLSAHLDQAISVEDLAKHAGMSRAVFHRKFKEATTMSPLQFLKTMRLNKAAMQIASGTSVSEASRNVGYTSASQFSREFKRTYGQSPKKWGLSSNVPSGVL
ncbi:MAG: AraC family transcriptional regulator [Litorimonas sp.]